MAKYIDKDALVAEIDKGINGRNDWQFDDYRKGYCDALIMLKKYLFTIEVKEVDIEKELSTYLEVVKATDEDINFVDFAKHFFELALSLKNNKVQKGE